MEDTMDCPDPPDMPKDERMPPIELKLIREWLGVSGDWLAEQLDVTPRTVRNWESGKRPIPDGVRLEIEHMETLTANAVTSGVEALMDTPEPAVMTYYSDSQYREHDPESNWPATWHRRVVARIAQEVPGLVIVSPEEPEAE